MPMPFVLQNAQGSPANQLAVDGAFQALRASIRPLDHTLNGVILGHYRQNLITGTTVSLAANAPIASLRWAPSITAFFVLLRAYASANVNAAITTGTPVDLEMITARGYTAADTGGTAITPFLGSNQKNRATMGTSMVADMRVSSTAALTAGTRTLDAFGFAFAAFQLGLAISGAQSADGPKALYQWDALGQYPEVLGPNEGIVFRVPTAGPTTGGIRYGITLEWAEVAVF